MTFKVGDKVRCIQGYDTSLLDGDYYTVYAISDKQETLQVHGTGYWWSFTRFELAQTKGAEVDPTGKSQHEAGAKVDAGKPRMSLVMGGFAGALLEVGKIGTFGANKYTDNGWRTVPNGFQRYEDAQMRHQLYRHNGEVNDSDSNYLHLAHEAWNALAKLQLFLDSQDKA